MEREPMKFVAAAVLSFLLGMMSGCSAARATGDTVETAGRGTAHAVSGVGEGAADIVGGTGRAVNRGVRGTVNELTR